MTTTATNNRIAVEIVKSTRKAHLVKDSQGREGWIQQRWLREDGTVAAATFEKSAANKAGRDAGLKEEREFRNAKHPVAAVRETEKAIACEVTLEFVGNETPSLVWLPKSQCELREGGKWLVPGWLIRAKNSEAADGFRPSGSYERHRWCKGERPTLVRGVQVIG